MNTPLVIGILILLFGIYLRYWINRRRFNRRGPSGLQHFASYEKSVATRSIEGFCKLLAYASILIGLFLIINNW
ncbi:molybdenum ABC transporter permease [Sphingobacterium hungaricum]|uniref:Molybdenum ABC transporter permease n=1 Tax=Sphingobacterium hungaricum TaxID=2082723 RepID=A0A928UU06_9SPHI|nr:molybdenum ABC transporter permease [Sphingobacterium hungaricum]MBE8712717.1 molybdenum ABC transporter permease [Sphingobacterium hungaricum]